MMTQGVMTQIASPSRLTTGNSQLKSITKPGEFDRVMNQNLEYDRNDYSVKQNPPKDTKRTKQDIKGTKVASRNDQRAERAVKKESDNIPDSEIEAVSKENPKSLKKVDIKDVTKVKEDSVEDTIIQDQLVGMLQALQAAVMEVLNITQEELDQLLEEQGLTLGDLTKTDALKQLILGINGKTDVLEFLTDGDLAASLHNLNSAVKTIQEDFGLQLSEEEFDLAISKLLETETMLKDESDEVLKVSMQEELSVKPAIQKDTSILREQKEEQDVEVGNKPSIEVIRVEEPEDTKEGMLRDTNSEDSKETESGKQFEVFLDNLVTSKGETKVEFTGDAIRVTELREIASQIIERIKVVMKPEQTSMELQLNPEHLGKVQLHVQSKEGSMTAQFIVQNEMTKEAIEGQLQILKDTLEHQGIKVEAIEVTVASNTFDQGRESEQNGQQAGKNQSRGHRITLDEAISMQDGTEPISQEESIKGITGTNIDMTA